MSKVIHLPIDIEVNRHATQVGVRVSVHEQALQELCLGLCLLAEGLIELLVVGELRGAKVLKLRHGTKQGDDPRAQISLKANASLIELTPIALKYMQHFFLRYYRDGIAEVDHIDIEATETDPGGSDAYLTMRVDNAKPPLSPEEALERLRG